MASNSQIKAGTGNRAAALATVFGLVPASAVACPNLISSTTGVRSLIQLVVLAVAAIIVVGLVLGVLFVASRSGGAIGTNPDKTALLAGQQWARWQYAPGEWQQSSWAVAHPNAMQVPTPWILVGPYGVCHETKGFQSVRNLRSVNFLPRDQAFDPNQNQADNMGRLVFVMNDGEPVQVSVPNGKEGEAQALVVRYMEERLQGPPAK